MMKFITILVASTLTTAAFAKTERIHECWVTEVTDKTYFKKQLDAKKNNQVIVETTFKKGTQITLGTKVYNEAEDSEFTTESNAIDDTIWSITPPKSKDKILLIFSGVPGRLSGRIMVAKNGKDSENVAAFTCFKEVKDDE